MVGPYLILAKEGYSFRVQLPALIKIHLVFALNLLYKDKDNPLLGQAQEANPLLQVINNYKQEVNKLLTIKKIRNKLFYYTNQLGHNKDLEQYLASDFKYAPHKLKAFHLYYPELLGPPHKLNDQLQAQEEGKDDYNNLDNNITSSQSLQTSFF